MSYQGVRKDRDGKTFIRYRIKGELIEVGPYDTAAQALKENYGRDIPPQDAPRRYLRDPNIQSNVPRTEEAKKIREAIAPSMPEVDYSKIEERILNSE